MEPGETTESFDPAAAADSRLSPLGIAGFAVSAVAGLVIGIGSLLPWAAVQLGQADSALVFNTNGIDIAQGLIALAAGIVVLAGALAVRVGKSDRGRPAVAALILLGAIVATLICVQFAATAQHDLSERSIVEFAEKLSRSSGLPADAIADRERQLIAEGKAAEFFSLEMGVWITLGGGIAGIAGGVMALQWSRKPAAAPPEREAEREAEPTA